MIHYTKYVQEFLLCSPWKIHFLVWTIIEINRIIECKCYMYHNWFEGLVIGAHYVLSPYKKSRVCEMIWENWYLFIDIYTKNKLLLLPTFCFKFIGDTLKYKKAHRTATWAIIFLFNNMAAITWHTISIYIFYVNNVSMWLRDMTYPSSNLLKLDCNAFIYIIYPSIIR